MARAGKGASGRDCYGVSETNVFDTLSASARIKTSPARHPAQLADTCVVTVHGAERKGEIRFVALMDAAIMAMTRRWRACAAARN